MHIPRPPRPEGARLPHPPSRATFDRARLGLRDRLLVRACRASHRLYGAVEASVRVHYGSHSVVVPIGGHLGLFNVRIPNRSLLATLLRVYAPGISAPFVDVGANIAQSLLALVAVAPRVPYIGFEPDITAAAYVQRTIRANGLTNHVLFPLALSERPGLGILHNSREADESATVEMGIRPEGRYAHHVAVSCLRGDDILPALGVREASLLKIDVEGHEMAVLHGLEDFLAVARPPVFFEALAWTHLADGHYSREYYGELEPPAREALVAKRRATRRALGDWFTERGYTIELVTAQGEFAPVARLETDAHGPADQNFLASPPPA